MYSLLLPVTIPSAKSALPARYFTVGLLRIFSRMLYSASDVRKLKFSEETFLSVIIEVNLSEEHICIPTVES